MVCSALVRGPLQNITRMPDWSRLSRPLGARGMIATPYTSQAGAGTRDYNLKQSRARVQGPISAHSQPELVASQLHDVHP